MNDENNDFKQMVKDFLKEYPPSRLCDCCHKNKRILGFKICLDCYLKG